VHWPRRRSKQQEQATSARTAGGGGQSADALTRNVAAEPGIAAVDRPLRPPAWSDLARLAPSVSSVDPTTTHALGFAHSITTVRALTARVTPLTQEAERPSGMVYLDAHALLAHAHHLDLDAEPEVAHDHLATPLDAMLPPRVRARPLTVVGEHTPALDLVQAPDVETTEIPVDVPGDEHDGDDGGGPGLRPQPGTPQPPAPVASTPPAPTQMRVFRPRRLGLGEPMREVPAPNRQLPPRDEARREEAPPIDEPPDLPPITSVTPVDAVTPSTGPAIVYRASAQAPLAAGRYPRTHHTEPVPSDLAATLSSAFGVDVGRRPIHRGPEVTRDARAMGARAFTRQRDVFVSDDVGPLSVTDARATIAHELTHVAQQTTLGAALPDEGTAPGRRLEAAARSVEDFVRGEPDAPRPSPELLHPDRVPQRPEHGFLSPDEYVMQVADELEARGLAYRDPSGDLVIGPKPTDDASAGVQRQQAATHSTMHARDAGEFFHDLGTEFQHGVVGQVLDFWGVDDNTRKEFEQEEEIERRRWDKLHDENAAIDAANAAHPNLPAKPHRDELTDEELAQIRADVTKEHGRKQQQTGAGGTGQHAAGGATTGTGHDAHTPKGGTASHTAGHADAGAGHGSPATSGTKAGGHTGSTTAGGTQGTAGTAGEHRRAMLRDAGNWFTGGVIGDVAGFYGIDRAALTGGAHQQSATKGRAGDTGGHTGGAHAAAGTAHAAGAAAHGAGAEHDHDAHGAHDVHDAHGAHAAGAQGHAFADLQDDEVEELLRRVYPRLRTALRTELLIDRERAGLLADFR